MRSLLIGSSVNQIMTFIASKLSSLFVTYSELGVAIQKIREVRLNLISVIVTEISREYARVYQLSQFS